MMPYIYVALYILHRDYTIIRYILILTFHYLVHTYSFIESSLELMVSHQQNPLYFHPLL